MKLQRQKHDQHHKEATTKSTRPQQFAARKKGTETNCKAIGQAAASVLQHLYGHRRADISVSTYKLWPNLYLAIFR